MPKIFQIVTKGRLTSSQTEFTKIALTIALTAGLITCVRAQISYTGGTYAQDLDIIVSQAAPLHRLGGLLGLGTGDLTGTAVTPGTGGSTAGANFNFGVAGVNAVTDRALGSLASGGLQRDTELQITNNTGANIFQFNLSYDGEEWRNGGSMSVANTLTLQISLTGLSR